MNKSKHFYLLVVLSIISFTLAIVIGYRVFNRVEDKPRPHPRQTDVSTMQTWMTLPYVSKVYGVPLPEFDRAFGLDASTHNKSIATIAKRLNKDPQVFLTEIQTVITTFKRP